MKKVEAEIFFGEEQIKEMQYEFLKQGILVPADDLRARVNQVKQDMRSPAFGHLAGIEENVRTLAKDVFEKRWFILEAAPGTAFITSDCPVHTANMNLADKTSTLGSGFGHEDTAVVLPLSPTRLFLTGSHKMRWDSAVLTAHDVLAFNTGTVRFADRAAYSLDKSSDIQTLVDQEIGQVVYGQNAFVP
jgi:Protein of unknown function (DUF4238)